MSKTIDTPNVESLSEDSLASATGGNAGPPLPGEKLGPNTMGYYYAHPSEKLRQKWITETGIDPAKELASRNDPNNPWNRKP
jgi:hypothetical protein